MSEWMCNKRWSMLMNFGMFQCFIINAPDIFIDFVKERRIEKRTTLNWIKVVDAGR
ncbi:hypothetical protein SAMN05444487_11447 [Marininema mesophilum]|uniref:Uncharacterized protein n=1 Tax=Marininema mesophilum TaxID=1048340 RepID=A0A1H3ASY9_9BACL|nr:hypothetical protein SAMN05444487_11447 [Marininema mesophilum]